MFYKNKRTVQLIALITILFTATGIRAEPTQDTFSKPSQDGWTVGITPYLWATSMKGIVGIAHHDAHVDQSFSEVLKQLKFGWMLDMDANKGKFGLYAQYKMADAILCRYWRY